ncbi:unnamed protein product [Prorocentrum cordatum]|uniref:Uncharacterized protein n=1 Tax=Prorocentrum cordatum TaxID=2364126 RepID=A0ABN9UU35_9DINO|nr:unnamed protein product [Polarella glacialis]
MDRIVAPAAGSDAASREYARPRALGGRADDEAHRGGGGDEGEAFEGEGEAQQALSEASWVLAEAIGGSSGRAARARGAGFGGTDRPCARSVGVRPSRAEPGRRRSRAEPRARASGHPDGERAPLLDRTP